MTPSSRALTDALLVAAGDNDVELIEKLIAQGADPKAQDADGSNALQTAIFCGHHEAAALLLPLSDPDAIDCLGRTALSWAAEGGHERLVEMLLPVCDPNLTASSLDYTPLMRAIQERHDRCALLLAPVSNTRRHDAAGNTALSLAIISHQERLAFLLLESADSKQADAFGNTPLMNAIRHGSMPLIRALIDKFDPQIANGDGLTPLGLAAAIGRMDAAQALLPHEPDLAPAPAHPGRGRGSPARKSPRALAIEGEHDQVAALIEAFELARSERRALEQTAQPAPQTRPSPRFV